MESLLDDVSRRIARGVEDQVTQDTYEVEKEESRLDDHQKAGENRVQRDSDPRKESILLTMILACFCTMLILANVFMAFVYDIGKEETFWKQVSQFLLGKNESYVVTK